MKKGFTLITSMLLLFTLQIHGQNPAIEKLNAYKIAFFTKKLNLTTQEAEKFWPVYNELQNRRIALQSERAQLNRTVNTNELNMSEKELIDAADKLISIEVQEAMLAQEYHKKFKEILTPQKVVRLYQAENQYRMQLLQELRDNPQLQKNIQRNPGRNF
jgi:hypothetical protein